MTDILKVCDEIDAAGKKATPRPWNSSGGAVYGSHGVPELVEVHVADASEPDAEFIALAANHAQDMTTVVRRLVEYAQIVERIPNEKMTGVQWQLHLRLLDVIRTEIARDYPGLLASPPEAGRLEGGEERP